MMYALARRASHWAAALKRALSWPARVSAERRAMSQLDSGTLRLDADRSAMLAWTARRARAIRLRAEGHGGLKEARSDLPKGGKTVYEARP